MLCAWLALGAPTSAWTQAPDPAQRAALVAQKLSMIDQLLGSARAREVAQGDNADAKAALERARTLVTEARTSADAGEADQRANEALRLVSSATRRRGGGPAPVEGQVQRNRDQRAQVEEYRRNIVEALNARRAQGRTPLLVAVDQQLLDADDLTREGRHVDAAASLERAYNTAVQGLVRLREGETVTIALDFKTPADEYAYEQRRFQSHDLLVDVTLAERNPTGTMRNAVEQRRSDARALRDRAAESAARGDYKSAIVQLEDATKGLVRALQAAGVTGLY